MYEAKIFLDKKQDEHFEKHGVYADTNSKIAEWMQEYTDMVVKKLTIPSVVGQSEQLLDFIRWRKQVAVDDLNDKEVVEFYLARKIK